MAIPTKTIDEWIESLNATLFADPNKDDRICEAECNVSDCLFGKKYNLAVALYTTHLLALDNMGDGTSTDPNPVGVIAEEKEDRLTIKYRTGASTDSSNDQWLKLTNWGARFLMLRKGRTFMPRTSKMGCN